MMISRSHLCTKFLYHTVSKTALGSGETHVKVYSLIGNFDKTKKSYTSTGLWNRRFGLFASVHSKDISKSDTGNADNPLKTKLSSTSDGNDGKDDNDKNVTNILKQSGVEDDSLKNLTNTDLSSVLKSDPQNELEDVNKKENVSRAAVMAAEVAASASKKAVKMKTRVRVDLSATSRERNFITPGRAMSDFLLKSSDLEGLQPSRRRSAFENEPPILVYWRKDVEARAIEKWGSLEVLEKEKLAQEFERKFYEQTIFTTKRQMREFRRDVSNQTEMALAKTSGIFSPSGKVVLAAVCINGLNFIFKLTAWLYTGSHSMFSETVHSLADIINQLILAYGIHKSVQRANQDHPYGYLNMKYVASLISGVGIFCVGTGLSVYHGICGLLRPEEIDSFFWAYMVLTGSFVSEGVTCLFAYNSIKKGARAEGVSFKEYVLRGRDPGVNVVFLEDVAAVCGVVVAGTCMGISSYYNSVIPDAIGSLIIGGILGVVASFIIYSNVAALVGRSIPKEYLNKINTELESDVMIRAIYDVKGIDIGSSLIRYKAELDFDGRELTRFYLDKQDINALLEEVKHFKDIDELESFIVKHSEAIIDMMGGEIDRIELKLRRKFPEIRHCDLEIL